MPDSERDVTVSMPAYRLTLCADRPYAYVDIAGGRVTELFLLSTADCTSGCDATTAVGEWRIAVTADETVLTLEAASSVWERRVHQLHCRPGDFVYTTAVEGKGALTDVSYFGGYNAAYARWGAGLFHSGHRFTRGFTPEPNAAGLPWFDPREDVTIDLGGGPLPGRRHWFFTPAPFCYAFEAAAGWLAIGVEAAAGQYRFTELRYHGGEGFRLTLPYDGRTRVNGRYTLPAVRFIPSADPMDALLQHCSLLPRPGPAPRRDGTAPDWWREPIFCGWGAQCAQSAQELGYEPTGTSSADAFVATLRSAPMYSRQDCYKRWLSILAGHGVRPCTVVLDDKWQTSYGNNEVDGSKWPDLPGFVRGLHGAGTRVLLWLKAWDREGVPDEECISTAAGLPLTVDPTNPAYERRLRASVRCMLAPDGYDADGFKIDFTHRIPVGPGLRLAGDSWGLELMRRYLQIIHDEARQVKPDALVVAHAPHPYLADVVDMVRLNDMLDLTAMSPDHPGLIAALRHRAQIARICRPDAPIDTDNWPVPNRRIWREYIRAQPELGVPALYFATNIDITQEPLEADDYRLVRESWATYRADQGLGD